MAGGWLLGMEIKQTRLGDRYVAVKGLAERDVKSDLAIWQLGYKEAGDDLTALYAKSEGDKKAILQFLDKQGIQPNEIELGSTRKRTSMAARAHRDVISCNNKLRRAPPEWIKSQLHRRKPWSCCNKESCSATIRVRD